MFNGLNLFENSPFFTVSICFCVLFTAVILFLLKSVVKEFKATKSIFFKLLWTGCLVYFFFTLYLCFPGFLVVDDAIAAREIFLGHPYTWLSLSYAFILASGYIVMGKVGFIPIISISLFGYLILRALRIIDHSEASKKRKWISALLLLALSLNPIIQGLLLFHSRDILFSLLMTFIGMFLLDKNKWSVQRIVLLSCLVVFLSDLRAEAKVYLVLIPVLFFLVKQWGRKEVLYSYITMTIFGGLYLVLLPAFLGVYGLSIDYRVTTWVMPLSQIYHDVGVNNISEEINGKINPVLDVQKLESKFSPVDIDPFHAGAFNHQTTAHQWLEFKSAAIELLKTYPEIVLKNRINLFVNMLNVGQETFIFYDDFHGTNEVSLEIRSNLRESEKDYAFTPVAESYYNLLGGFGRSRNFFIQIFNSLVVPLAFCVYCLTLFWRRPEFFSFAALVLARIPIIFLLAPASYTRYILTVLLFFIVGCPLLLVLASRSEKQAVDLGV